MTKTDKLTVISHFYNEELFLPHWLRHHREFIDHGILINYASTDNSVDIIRELCPTWDIIDSRNEHFAVMDTTAEVMDIEKTIDDWKIALTMPEFLFLKRKELNITTSKAWRVSKDWVMVDVNPGTYDPSLPLLEQKHHGIIPRPHYHLRLVHCHPTGLYLPGRHISTHKSLALKDSMVLHYRLSPWPDVLPRLLQIKDKITSEDAALRRIACQGLHHFMTEEEMIEEYRQKVQQTVDIKRM